MTALEDPITPDPDLTASDVAWDLEPLVFGRGAEGVASLLEQAESAATRIESYRGRVGSLSAAELAVLMGDLAELEDAIGRAGSYVGLQFSVDTVRPRAGRGHAAFPGAGHRRQHPDPVPRARVGRGRRRSRRRAVDVRRPVLLPLLPRVGPSLPASPAHRTRGEGPHREARHRFVGVEPSVRRADVGHRDRHARRADQPRAGPVAARLAGPGGAPRGGRGRHRRPRARAAHPGVRVQHAHGRQGHRRPSARRTPRGCGSRNLANEASDESVQALVDAVVARYDIPQRWYRLKAQMLGVDRIADYDRNASVAEAEEEFALVAGHRGGARRLRLVLRRAGRRRAHVHRRQLDRRAGAAGQARRRLLLLHRAERPPLPAPQLDEPPP